VDFDSRETMWLERCYRLIMASADLELASRSLILLLGKEPLNWNPDTRGLTIPRLFCSLFIAHN
jgi:hypothetical protein